MGPARLRCVTQSKLKLSQGMASNLTDKDFITVAQFTGDACEDWQSFLIGLFVGLRRAVRPGVKVTGEANDRP